MNDYDGVSQRLDPEWIPNFSSTPNAGMEGRRNMEPVSNANYLNQSYNVALNLDEQFYHDPAIVVRSDFQNVVPVENVSHGSAASSPNSVRQVIYSNNHVNTRECSISVPVQQVSQPCQQNEFLQNLKLKEQIQMVQQLNASSMPQQLQKPLHQNVLEKLPQNDFDKEPLTLASPQPVVLQSSYYSPQEQQRMVRPHQNPSHIAQPPEVTSSLRANTLNEVLLDSTSHGQHAYVDDWFIKTYMKIQMLRERYAPEVEIIYKMANDLHHEPQSVASSTRNQKKSSVAKMIIKVLSFSKADLTRHTKDKVSRSLNVIEWHLNAIRIKRLGTMHHHEQPHPPANQSTTSQLQPNRNMDVISNQLRQGLTNQHAYSPQSSPQQGVSRSQENLINSPCNDSSVGNALCSFQNSPARSMQQSPPNHALQTNMVASPNIDSQFGLEQGSPSVLHHDGLGKLYKDMLSSQQKNPLPSTIVNTLVPTMSSLLTSSAINSSHVVNQRPKKQILHIEKMNQPIQKSRIEKNKQQMSVQKDFSFPQHMSNIQPAGYSPQSLRYSLPADHEKQSFCAENTVHLPKPPIPVEQFQATKRKYIPTGSSPETSPLSIQFDTPEISPQSQPFKRLTEVVKSMSSNTLCASLQDFNAIINLVDNIAGPTTSTDIVNRQISAAAFNSLSSFSTGTNFERWCGQAAGMVSTATYEIKKHKIEQNRDILGEIRAINLKLIETWLDVDSQLPEDAAGTGAGDGTIVRCSYTALGTLAESLRMQYSSSQTLPDFIVRWRVPADYPKSSPVLVDTLPGRWSEVLEDMSEKLELKLNQSIRKIPQPISLKEIVGKWDACARAVFTEFAEERVGKSLRSNLGTWENCITTS